MKFLICLTFILGSSISFADARWDGKIVNIKNQKEISRADFVEMLAANNIIVLGEKHYTEKVQTEEGRIIYDVVTFAKKENQFSTSWEFLNASSQQTTSFLFNQVINHEITSIDFLLKTQGFKGASVYAPMVETTAILGGQLFGVNLSREEKAPVVEKGLGALDPKLLPPGFKLGGGNYLERFSEAIRDHATPEQINNYFAAQSLVDDMAAFHLNIDSRFNLKFLVIGSFHSQFNDGVVARIKDRMPEEKVVNVEIIDCSEFSEKELGAMQINVKYGIRSDYAIFVNEPK